MKPFRNILIFSGCFFVTVGLLKPQLLVGRFPIYVNEGPADILVSVAIIAFVWCFFVCAIR